MNMDYLIIFGCVLCPVYCWIMGYISRSNELKFSKLGIAIGTVGVLTLSVMATVGASHNLEPEKERPIIMTETDGPDRQRNLLHRKLRLVYFRTLNAHGPRPSKDHVAYEDEKGKYSWIHKDNYLKILIKQRKKDSE